MVLLVVVAGGLVTDYRPVEARSHLYIGVPGIGAWCRRYGLYRGQVERGVYADIIMVS